MLNGWQKKKDNSLFFEPSWQEGNHFEVIAHQSDVMNVAEGAQVIGIPKGVNAVLVQAVNQNINYTLSDGSTPTPTSGFVLIAGNDPIAIPVGLHTTLTFCAAANGARLELQFGVV